MHAQVKGRRRGTVCWPASSHKAAKVGLQRCLQLAVDVAVEAGGEAFVQSGVVAGSRCCRRIAVQSAEVAYSRRRWFRAITSAAARARLPPDPKIARGADLPSRVGPSAARKKLGSRLTDGIMQRARGIQSSSFSHVKPPVAALYIQSCPTQDALLLVYPSPGTCSCHKNLLITSIHTESIRERRRIRRLQPA